MVFLTIGYTPTKQFLFIFLTFLYLMFSLNTQRHAFHLVDPSILPLLTSIGALSLTLGSVLFFHGFSGGLESTFFGFITILLCMFL
jgi:cytochrome c oxidase subunit 3